MILLCYDGSNDAQAAIERVGEMLGGQATTILTVWEPFVNVMARTGPGLTLGAGPVDFEGIDAASEQAARERAEEGVERAHRAGLDGQPRIAARGTTIAGTILSEADAVGATLVVVGTRGLTGLKSAFLGSVSHAVLRAADRPILVVPSPEVASERAASRR